LPGKLKLDARAQLENRSETDEKGIKGGFFSASSVGVQRAKKKRKPRNPYIDGNNSMTANR